MLKYLLRIKQKRNRGAAVLDTAVGFT